MGFHSVIWNVSLVAHHPKQSEKILALTTAAGVEVEPIWANLLAKALEGKNVQELLAHVGPSAGRPAHSDLSAVTDVDPVNDVDEVPDKDDPVDDSDDDGNVSFRISFLSPRS